MNNNIKTEVPEGYVLLQRHEGKPLYAACLDGGRWHGWLFKTGPEAGQWVSERKLEQWEVMQAEDQRDDSIVHETSGAHATQAVARYAGVDCGRYTIEWTNGPLPEGTEFFAAPLATPADAGADCEHCGTQRPLHLLTCPVAVKGMAEGKKKEAPEPLRQLLVDLSNNTYFCGLHLDDDAKYAVYLAEAEKAEQALIELFEQGPEKKFSRADVDKWRGDIAEAAASIVQRASSSFGSGDWSWLVNTIRGLAASEGWSRVGSAISRQSPAPVTAEPVAWMVHRTTDSHVFGIYNLEDDAKKVKGWSNDAVIVPLYAAPVSPQPAAQVPSRDDVLEEAAKVAEAHVYGPAGEYDYSYGDAEAKADDRADHIADAIRARKDQPAAAHAAKEGGQQ